MPYESALKLYARLLPGAIGHCETDGTPSSQGVPVCCRPCQWSGVPSSGLMMALLTLTVMISPQLASIVGPRNWPLMSSTSFSEPSSAMVPRAIVKS